ncbi:hypothetical protein [Sediminicola luteus]|uniref:Phosphatidic acid phosphatase type 2/haloperoxidase domain-containing protein n=1 Tax=Sediminicola luteus TaxID=319238 RepID=A0A2A4G424_9FLAO|nr:hypothetical protein [Sediminicola luteus]PCE63193.1 hypothetical protein B7P33_13260 [Sediminicola luteus]
MNQLARLISYLYHPLFMPLIGCITYFMVSPRYNSAEEVKAILFPIFILTILVPILCFYILKKFGVVKSVFLFGLKERKYPYMIQLCILLFIVYKLLPNRGLPELYYFFLAVIAAFFSALVLLLMRFKVSMHVMAISSILVFTLALSLHFHINLTVLLAFLVASTGILITVRYYLKAHSPIELLLGFLLGVTAQMLTFKFWL